MTAPHPSARTLDLVALGHERPEVAQHVESCETCLAHVRASSPAKGPVPDWVLERSPRRRHRGWPVMALSGAFAAVLLLVIRASPPKDSDTRPKGFPSFSIYVAHQGSVRLWDGRSTVAAADLLQLKVAAAGFRHLVIGVKEGGAWSPAFEGPVSPDGESALPLSFRLEPDTSTLELGLLLCDQPCPASSLQTEAQLATRDARRWWTSFTIVREDLP